MSLYYYIHGSGLLEIKEVALETFFNYKQRSFFHTESGGILFGYEYEGRICIDSVTVPSPKDKRGVFHFFRDKRRAQELVDHEFIRSQGKHIYIGEWHTHCQSRPAPSSKDIYEWRNAFDKSLLNLDFMVCIVVGNTMSLGNLWVGCVDGFGVRQIDSLSHCEGISQGRVDD
ncbi:Mov34/MPN/PAD-1 family protein [Desulfovibrio sp. TomC]|uniref:Mov34/MPN/PAD-1 family protein n=1 Tax=Desulfovibrio sp. TomC TaxID=1562888 RepID=UPI0009E45039|nr:Mov34/MPN/PAD-1 family protein [Desulfovibrio sp. TomC]